MTLTPDFWLSLGMAICAGFGTYAAIRADLATLHERASNAAKMAERAHQRIDEITNRAHP